MTHSKRKMEAIVFILGILAILSIGCPEKPSGNKLSNLDDSAIFKLYIRETLLGTFTNSIDIKGNYHRKAIISMAGQSTEYYMNITPDSYGDWEIIKIENPSLGTFYVRRSGNTAKSKIKGRYFEAEIPRNYIFYDDYGILLESVMLKKYDMEKKGKQTFQRFRIPEMLQINEKKISIELEFLEERTKFVNGKQQRFRIFNYKIFGTSAEYWVDQDSRIYLIHEKVTQTAAVRQGYEELLNFKTDTRDICQAKKTVAIPMRDGIKLATDLYFPEISQNDNHKKFPVILIRTPYKKEMSELDALNWAKSDYICAVQDVRGRFASGGIWEPFVNEATDGYDSVEWLAVQEYCDGKIAMIGSSYLGWVQLQTAVLKPPHLVTIIPNVVPPDPFFNFPYENGTFLILGTLAWVDVIEREATDDITGEKILNTFNYKNDLAFRHLPVIDLDKKILGKQVPYWRKWIQHHTNDQYWEKANYLDRLKNLEIPVFLQSGWFDGNSIGTKLSYLQLTKSKSKAVKLIIGPWGHSDKATTYANEQEMGDEAGIDLFDLYKRWFDYWLKGIDTGIMDEPLVQLYAINSHCWLKGDTYPLPGTQFIPFYINSSRGANTPYRDGSLQRVPPVIEPSPRVCKETSKDKTSKDKTSKDYDEYVYDPGIPTPSPLYVFKYKGEAVYNNILKARKDILVYNSPPLEEPITVVGPVSMVLYASSSAADTDWFVSWAIIQPNGKIFPLTQGAIRARFRNSVRKPELLEKNMVYEYKIDLWHTGITLAKGSIIHIEITSAAFPFYSRNLNTGGLNETETEYVKATQRIYHSPKYPSHLLLPVIKPENHPNN